MQFIITIIRYKHCIWQLCCLGYGDIKWHHDDPDGHKDSIITEKYGAIQVRIFKRGTFAGK